MPSVKRICSVLFGVILIVALSLDAEADSTILASSTFDADSEGWGVQDITAFPCVLGSGFYPDYYPAGGNPDGHIGEFDPSDRMFFFKAPEMFLGDKEGAYDGSLSFDRKAEAPPPGPAHGGFDVVLMGAGKSLVFDLPSAGTTWTSQTVTLNVEAGWEHCDGTPVTEAEMRSVLASLDTLLILGDMYDGYDTCFLDNVSIATSSIDVALDVKPGSCPNPLNVRSRGLLPVAILGTADLDVEHIDPASIRLEGVAPIQSSEQDVATPFEPFTGKEDCEFDCNDWGPDGWLDLTLKFMTQEIVSELGERQAGGCAVLSITGNLKEEYGGAPIQGQDVVTIINRGGGRLPEDRLVRDRMSRRPATPENSAPVRIQRRD